MRRRYSVCTVVLARVGGGGTVYVPLSWLGCEEEVQSGLPGDLENLENLEKPGKRQK